MRDDEVLEALTSDLLGALGTPESLGVARVLASTGADDLIERDVEGQLPAVGVADVDLEPTERVGIGSKKWKGKVGWEITIAAPAAGESSAEGRDTIRRVLGLINKQLDDRVNPFKHRFRFAGFSYIQQPRRDAVVGLLRYESSAIFGNE